MIHGIRFKPDGGIEFPEDIPRQVRQELTRLQGHAQIDREPVPLDQLATGDWSGVRWLHRSIGAWIEEMLVGVEIPAGWNRPRIAQALMDEVQDRTIRAFEALVGEQRPLASDVLDGSWRRAVEENDGLTIAPAVGIHESNAPIASGVWTKRLEDLAKASKGSLEKLEEWPADLPKNASPHIRPSDVNSGKLLRLTLGELTVLVRVGFHPFVATAEYENGEYTGGSPDAAFMELVRSIERRLIDNALASVEQRQAAQA